MRRQHPEIDRLEAEGVDLLDYIVYRKNGGEKIDRDEVVEWRRKFRRIPESVPLLSVNPENFYPRKVKKFLQDILGVQKATDLTISDQIAFRNLVKGFGINIDQIGEREFLEAKEVRQMPVNIKIKEMKIPENLSLEQKITFVLLASFDGRFMKMVRSGGDYKERIDFISNLVRVNPKAAAKALEIFDTYAIRQFMKYKKFQGDTNMIIGAINVYENRASSHRIPLISGKAGKYSYRVLKKDDPEGLIAGSATNCCQTPTGVGRYCCAVGYECENSSFIVIEKDGKIYAQSWLWEFSHHRLKFLVFDSVEVLSGSELDEIKKCYAEAMDKFKEHYDRVVVGDDDYGILSGYRYDSTECLLKDFNIEDIKVFLPDPESIRGVSVRKTYSDVRAEARVI